MFSQDWPQQKSRSEAWQSEPPHMADAPLLFVPDGHVRLEQDARSEQHTGMSELVQFMVAQMPGVFFLPTWLSLGHVNDAQLPPQHFALSSPKQVGPVQALQEGPSQSVEEPRFTVPLGHAPSPNEEHCARWSQQVSTSEPVHFTLEQVYASLSVLLT